MFRPSGSAIPLCPRSPLALAGCGEIGRATGMNKKGSSELISLPGDCVSEESREFQCSAWDDGKWGAEFQLKDDVANHPELRGLKEAEEIGQVLNSIHLQYLCQEHRKERIYYTSCHMSPRCQVAKLRTLEIIGRELGWKPWHSETKFSPPEGKIMAALK